MITTEFLSSLDKFHLIIKKRVTSKYTGARKSLVTGRGTTIKDHRIYASGDDFRLIDWKIYARTDNLYVKQYEEERNLKVHVILDYSSSMNYGKPTKYDYGAMLGTGFAYLSMKENEKFQFATFSEKLDIFRPQRGKQHLLSMVDYLNKLKIGGQSNFLDAMKQYRKSIGRRSMMFIISDFLFPIEEIEAALWQLGEQDIKVVQVLSEEEKNLSITGDVKLKDLETGDQLNTFISPRLKMDYQQDLEQHVRKIGKICNDIQAQFHVATTEKPIFDSFHEILED